MGQPELTITTGGGVKAPTGGEVPPEVAAAARRSPRRAVPRPAPGDANARTQELHRQQHEQHAAEQAEADTADVDAAVAEKPREDIETVECRLPDGREVVFGPPSGVSLTARVAMLMAGQPPSDAMDMIARCCISVRSLDGKKLPPITNRVDIQKCANIIGDAGLDVLAYLLSEYWPAVKLKELATIKKNLRGP